MFRCPKGVPPLIGGRRGRRPFSGIDRGLQAGYAEGMTKTYRPYNVDQQLLLPPNLRDWLPESHLALFVSDVVDTLDLGAIFRSYEQGDGRGRPPYHPQMMVKLLVYGYCTGVRSSRKIERATYEDVAFRVLAAGSHPDHDSIAEFRKRHLKALSGLFLQVLALCRRAGLVKLGHVAIDGTKMRANAGKHKAMSYGRMEESERRLEEEVRRLLEEAERVDAEEDAQFGKGNRGDELPAELARRESRLRKIREAKAALEREASEKASAEAEGVRLKQEERKLKEQRTGKKAKGRPLKVPDPKQARPEAKAQRNFTDPDARIMLDGATKGFVYGYNAQAAVDAEAQIVVAATLTQAAVDSAQLLPMLTRIEANVGRLPERVSADAGYYSEANLTDPKAAGVDLHIPPGQRERASRRGPGKPMGPVATAMREKLASPGGKACYKMRKAIVEPFFGQTKDVRGFRGFLFRGLRKVSAEWDLICLTHNLLKLFRSGFRPGLA